MTVCVQLNLPEDVYRALVPKATKAGTQVHLLLEAAVTRSVRVTKKPARKGPAKLTAEELAQRKADRRAAFHADTADARHGTHNGYVNLGCRCDRCKTAAAQYEFERKNR